MSSRTQLASLLIEHVAELSRHRDAHHPRETGGILMGFDDGAGRLVVTGIVGPGPRAVHKEHSFEPDWEWQQRQVADRYAASGRRETYVGDWHSHPGRETSPSRLDRQAAREIARYPDARLLAPLFIILGWFHGDLTIGAYVWRSRKFRHIDVSFRAAS